jgi:hypothetical protein
MENGMTGYFGKAILYLRKLAKQRKEASEQKAARDARNRHLAITGVYRFMRERRLMNAAIRRANVDRF